MTQRHFVTPDYTVFAGWNAESQSLYLNIYHHFWEDPADRNRYDTPLTAEHPTVADVAEALARYHITPPSYFLEDLAEDQAHDDRTNQHVTYHMPVDLRLEGDGMDTSGSPADDSGFDPNRDPHLGQQTWYRFTMPNGQEFLRTANDVVDADWHGPSEVDVFRDARWEPMHDGGWLLYGTKENGQRLPISSMDGDADVHYDPETGTASIQAEYGDRPDLGDAVSAEPVEHSRLQALAERIRTWFHRDHDRGMGL
jgi:hypothetical protein